MTAIAPHITAFLRERLPRQRGASEHTCQSYAYAFQLLFRYASERFNVSPSALELEQLETERGNTASTRNGRLAAIKSFMRFCEYREPAILEQS
jgi:integrase/recombinase XerD